MSDSGSDALSGGGRTKKRALSTQLKSKRQNAPSCQLSTPLTEHDLTHPQGALG